MPVPIAVAPMFSAYKDFSASRKQLNLTVE